jgi:hypothetical protein
MGLGILAYHGLRGRRWGALPALLTSLLLALLLLLFLAGPAGAQVKQRFQLGIGPYGMLYTGDLSTQKEWFHRVYPGLNLSLQFDSPKLIVPQLNAGFGKITGEDRNLEPVNGIQPNTFVSTTYFYIDGRFHLQFFRRQRFRPRVGLGFGLLNYTPKGQQGQNLQQQLQTRKEGEDYNTTAPHLPMTIGFKYSLNDFVSLGMDLTRFNVFTDYIDNIGELGTNPGNDRLNSLLVSIYFTPGYKKRLGRSGR